ATHRQQRGSGGHDAAPQGSRAFSPGGPTEPRAGLPWGGRAWSVFSVPVESVRRAPPPAPSARMQPRVAGSLLRPDAPASCLLVITPAWGTRDARAPTP